MIESKVNEKKKKKMMKTRQKKKREWKGVRRLFFCRSSNASNNSKTHCV